MGRLLLALESFFQRIGYECGFIFFMVNAFSESLSFDAQKKVTKEKGTLPV
jgi:hypothetical protein